MNLWASILVAVKSLLVNSLRSGLTMLGIIIGVGAVVTMVAVGTGAQVKVEQQIRNLGANLILVRPGAVTSGGARLGSGGRHTLTEDDAVAIQKEIPGVMAASASVRGTAQLVHGNFNWSTELRGITPEYFVVREWPIDQGKIFGHDAVSATMKVALIGRTVANNLFGDIDPVGQIIRVNKIPFTVVGVMSVKGQSLRGEDEDDVIMIPISTAKRRVLGNTSAAHPRSVRAVIVKVRDTNEMPRVIEDMRQILRQRHRLSVRQGDDFAIRNLAEILATRESSTRTLTILLAAIASVSLLVGGIGIMNIMLVSVTERTREIGIRMAVGARGKDILMQFLIEAVTLSVIGGVIGISFGILFSYLIAHFAQWPILISIEAISVAFGFSAAVGVFFGFYPARKAARLDPIIALRYE
ncbi:MAG: ABC transporter permease [Rhodospirillales bacterium]